MLLKSGVSALALAAVVLAWSPTVMAQATGGSTGLHAESGKKATNKNSTIVHAKSHKGGKKSKKSSGGTTPPPK